MFCNLENLFFLFFFLLIFHYSFSFALQRWLYNIFKTIKLFQYNMQISLNDPTFKPFDKDGLVCHE
jgi:hypothetical protein